MSQWTPGPWLVMGNWYIVTDKDRTMVATTLGGYPKKTAANACLIALAPEMAQGLRAIVQVLDGSQPMDPKGALFVAQTLLARLDA